MNVASLELCKELYELSGWNSGQRAFYTFDEDKMVETNAFDEDLVGEIRKYDLGYLIRKLPPYVQLMTMRNGCDAVLKDLKNTVAVHADTPEDAACKLAIELFEQGILSPTTK